jgi:hypothetical protein
VYKKLFFSLNFLSFLILWNPVNEENTFMTGGIWTQCMSCTNGIYWPRCQVYQNWCHIVYPSTRPDLQFSTVVVNEWYILLTGIKKITCYNFEFVWKKNLFPHHKSNPSSPVAQFI